MRNYGFGQLIADAIICLTAGSILGQAISEGEEIYWVWGIMLIIVMIIHIVSEYRDFKK